MIGPFNDEMGRKLMAHRRVAMMALIMVVAIAVSAGEDRRYVRPSLPDGDGLVPGGRRGADFEKGAVHSSTQA